MRSTFWRRWYGYTTFRTRTWQEYRPCYNMSQSGNIYVFRWWIEGGTCQEHIHRNRQSASGKYGSKLEAKRDEGNIIANRTGNFSKTMRVANHCDQDNSSSGRKKRGREENLIGVWWYIGRRDKKQRVFHVCNKSWACKKICNHDNCDGWTTKNETKYENFVYLKKKINKIFCAR
jgi:hypothetical protein